jgi:hypothetical protein
MSNSFITSATNTLKDVAKTMQERGAQYSDTWGEKGSWNLTRALIKEYTGKDITDDECKAITLAGFVDQKYSRLAGGYSRDTMLDLIPYAAALVDVFNKEKNNKPV